MGKRRKRRRKAPAPKHQPAPPIIVDERLFLSELKRAILEDSGALLGETVAAQRVMVAAIGICNEMFVMPKELQWVKLGEVMAMALGIACVPGSGGERGAVAEVEKNCQVSVAVARTLWLGTDAGVFTERLEHGATTLAARAELREWGLKGD